MCLQTENASPTEEQESIRSIVRCRLALKKNEKNVKLQINSFPLTHGLRWPKSNWTVQHRTWLSKLKLRDNYSQKVLSEYLGHLEYLSARISSLDEVIKEIADLELYKPSVKKLCTFKGISVLSAMILITEMLIPTLFGLISKVIWLVFSFYHSLEYTVIYDY